MDRAKLRGLLSEHGLHLSRDLGQNFLVDAAFADELARRAGAQGSAWVIEVGTGLGVLTRAVAHYAARVRSVEIDSGLVRVLESEDLLPENVELVHADARRVDYAAWLAEMTPAGPVRVIANLPYSVATPLLRTFLGFRDALTDWSVMIQKEVARRLVARCGEDDYGSLSVLHGLVADVDTVATLPPAKFFPSPKVDSAFVRVWPRPDHGVSEAELSRVEQLARAGFGQRRKQLRNGLQRLADRSSSEQSSRESIRAELEARLRAVEIDPDLRPERVPPEAWLRLARSWPGGAGAGD